MRCRRCESDNPDGCKFCIESGMPLRPRCPGCRADTLPWAKCCSEYRLPLTGQAPAPHRAHLQPLLSDTPGHLAEKILLSKTAIEGEYKQVTVLFADLKGSMKPRGHFWRQSFRCNIDISPSRRTHGH
jgi:hypothetical protein